MIDRHFVQKEFIQETNKRHFIKQNLMKQNHIDDWQLLIKVVTYQSMNDEVFELVEFCLQEMHRMNLNKLIDLLKNLNFVIDIVNKSQNLDVSALIFRYQQVVGLQYTNELKIMIASCLDNKIKSLKKQNLLKQSTCSFLLDDHDQFQKFLQNNYLVEIDFQKCKQKINLFITAMIEPYKKELTQLKQLQEIFIKQIYILDIISDQQDQKLIESIMDLIQFNLQQTSFFYSKPQFSQQKIVSTLMIYFDLMTIEQINYQYINRENNIKNILEIIPYSFLEKSLIQIFDNKKTTFLNDPLKTCIFLYNNLQGQFKQSSLNVLQFCTKYLKQKCLQNYQQLAAIYKTIIIPIILPIANQNVLAQQILLSYLENLLRYYPLTDQEWIYLLSQDDKCSLKKPEQNLIDFYQNLFNIHAANNLNINSLIKNQVQDIIKKEIAECNKKSLEEYKKSVIILNPQESQDLINTVLEIEDKFEEINMFRQQNHHNSNMTQSLFVSNGYLNILNPSIYNQTQNYDIQVLNNQIFKGITNLGNTCYMNAFIQCLYHVSKFKNEIIQMKKNNQHSLLNHLKDLFNDLSNQDRQTINPLKFRMTIPEPFRSSNRQQDASEFGIFYLESLEISLQNSQYKGFLWNNGSLLLFGVLKYKEVLLNTAYENVKKIWKSRISSFNDLVNNIFYIQLESQLYCGDCQQVSKTQEKMFNIVLSFNENQLEYDFLQMFKNSFKEEKFLDQLFCYNCNKKSQEATKTILISELPPYLVLNLNRFQYNFEKNQKEKILKQVRIQEQFNVNQIYSNLDVKLQEQGNYYLSSFIVHKGISSEQGHYYAMVKDFENDKWNLINDEEVLQIKNVQVLDEIFSDDETPYIFFYQNKTQQQLKINTSYASQKFDILI